MSIQAAESSLSPQKSSDEDEEGHDEEEGRARMAERMVVLGSKAGDTADSCSSHCADLMGRRRRCGAPTAADGRCTTVVGWGGPVIQRHLGEGVPWLCGSDASFLVS